MNRTGEDGAKPEMKAAKSVVVMYEDTATRARATEFCDQLMRRFWAQFEIEASWFSFDVLAERAQVGSTAGKAAAADVVVFAVAPEGDFPLEVKAWLEDWLRQRGEREGTLVALIDPAESADGPEGPKHRFLRNAALRGAMDYLTQVPDELSRSIPDSYESYSSRADHVTSLLDGILHQQPRPSGPAAREQR